MMDLSYIYDTMWPNLSERFFKEEPWPMARDIAGLVDDDPLFLTLYKELYYRHLYGQKSATLTMDERTESYENYCDLFNYIVHNNDSPDPVDLHLPNRWLWDIIDEFIYQFESCAQYRVTLANKSEEELEYLKENPRLWNVHIVLNVLHSLIEKSQINEQLEAYKRGEDPEDYAGDYGTKPLYKMLGYFSLIGLLRLHCLLGDYYQALRVMENIELNKKGLYSTVPACQVTIFYYVGFSYLMMGRYQDAVQTCTNILYYIIRMQASQKKFVGYIVRKKREQLFNLLAIAITLNPQRIDDGVQTQLIAMCGEKMARMQKGDAAVFEELFQYGCPKFLMPTAPNYDQLTEESCMEPYRLQMKIFMNEMQQSLKLPLIRSYLKLYSTMSIEKLAAFCDLTEDEFRIHLHQYKHKSNQLTWTEGTALDGVRIPTVDVDFFLDNEMIHIADVKVARNFGEFFVASIHKMMSTPTN